MAKDETETGFLPGGVHKAEIAPDGEMSFRKTDEALDMSEWTLESMLATQEQMRKKGIGPLPKMAPLTRDDSPLKFPLLDLKTGQLGD